MNEKRNFDYKRLHPFKWYILENFPFLEDSIDVLTNYQLFCKLGEMYNKEIDSINALGVQVEGITDWFDNLDVQDEVNKKLDEMAESGELEEIIAAYINTNALICFNTVANLKAAENLVDGSYAITLGYHNINDDGGAIYKIRTITNNDVVDNMFIIELEDDSLIAELVIENEININQLGADNTGVNDSSEIFNDAFEWINNKWLNGENRLNTLSLNGKYKWLTQVKMPPCAKMNNSGFTTILTNVSGSALNIDYLSNDLPQNYEGNKQDWLQGELINFSQGGLFKNIGDNYTNTCIEIGRNVNIDEYHPYSRYKLCNFRIYNYSIGILHNRFHNYMGKFDNISFESNTTGVQYAPASSTVNDSGENMTYNNCLFATGTDGVKWLTDGFDSSFVNCSFDYLTNCFNDSENKGYKRISVVNSHLEGFTYICAKLGGYSQLVISNSSLVFSQSGNIFSNIHATSNISIDNSKILPIKTNEYDPTKMIDISGRLSLLNNFIGHSNITYLFNGANQLTNFDKLSDGSVTIAENSTIGPFKITAVSGGTFTGSIVTDNYLYTGHKSLVLTNTAESTSQKNIHLQTDYIPLSNIRTKLYTNMFTYNCCGYYQIIYSFYDADKNIISETTGYVYIPENSNKTKNEWHINPYGKAEPIPSNTAYVKIKYILANVNNSIADAVGTIYKLGGAIVN